MITGPRGTVQWLAPSALDASDRTFAVSPEWLLPEALLESVRAVGVVTPLRLLTGEGGSRVLSGFRRLAAARAAGLDRIPCLLLPAQGRSPLDWFVEVLHENLGSREFGPVERANALAKLHDGFGVPEPELLERFLPLLGLRADRRHLLESLKMARLPEDLQRALPDLIPEAAFTLAAWRSEERAFFLDFRERYRLGRNRQRELLELLDELRAMERLGDPSAGTPEIWRASGAEALDDLDHPTPDRLHKILDALRARRFPRLREHEERARRLRAALRLPPEIQFNLPRHFEGDRISVQFSVRDSQELRLLAEKLLRTSRRSELEALFALL